MKCSDVLLSQSSKNDGGTVEESKKNTSKQMGRFYFVSPENVIISMQNDSLLGLLHNWQSAMTILCFCQ